MRTIQLTRGKVALVDDGDFEFLNQWKWYAKRGRHTWYAARDNWSPRQKSLQMHRVIMDAQKGQEVDHVDRDGLNCQRHNLRVAAKAGNQRNQGLSTRNKTGFKRVWKTTTGRFRASITVNGKSLYLGTFDEPREAARAYDVAAQNHFGEFAVTNAALNLI